MKVAGVEIRRFSSLSVAVSISSSIARFQAHDDRIAEAHAGGYEAACPSLSRPLLYQPRGPDVRISINDNEETAKNAMGVLRLDLAELNPLQCNVSPLFLPLSPHVSHERFSAWRARTTIHIHAISLSLNLEVLYTST